MSFGEWIKKEKKKEEEEKKTTSTSKPSFSEWIENEKVKEVDSEYINSFFTDVDSFFTSAEEEYKGIGWGNASSSYTSRLDTWNALNSRASRIEKWLEKNETSLDLKTFNSLSSTLDDIYKGANSILETFKGQSDYYSKFKTEDEYNQYLKDYEEQQKEIEYKANYDLDAAQNELDRLKNAYAHMEDLQNRYNKTSDSTLKAKIGQDIERLYNEYGDYKTLGATIKEKENELRPIIRYQEGIKLSSVNNPESEHYDPEFDSYAKYESKPVENWWEKLTSQYGLQYSDVDYEYINGANKYATDRVGQQTNLRSYILDKARAFHNETLDVTWEEKFHAYDEMTEDEIAIYNYYYAKEGKEKANQYLNSIMETLNSRLASKMFEDVKGNTFLELVFSIPAGLDQFNTGLDNLFSNDDYYIPSATQMTSGLIREDLSDDGFKLPEWMGGASIGQVAYDMGTTTSNMLPSMIVSSFVPGAGAALGSITLGASAAGNAKAEMINLGYSKEQANTYGLLVGASEAGLQYLLGGISKLGGKASKGLTELALSKVDKALARFAIQYGSSVVSEGFEEGLQTVLEPFFKSLVGMDFEAPDASEVIYSALLGAMSAGFLEGGGLAIDVAKTYKQGADIKNLGTDSIYKLAEIGKGFEKDSAAYRLGNKVNEKSSNYDIGRLLSEVGESMSEQNRADIVKLLEAEGMTTNEAKKSAKWLEKALNEDYKLNRGQLQQLNNNEIVAKLYNEVITNSDSAINQRIAGYEGVQTDLEVAKLKEQLAKQKEKEAKKEAKKKAKNIKEDDVIDESLFEDVDFSDDEYDDNDPFGDEPFIEEEPIPIAEPIDKVNAKTTDGNDVEIEEIASINNGEITFKLKDGNTIKAKDVEYSDQKVGMLYETVLDMGLNAELGNVFVRGYDASEGLTVEEYAKGFREAFKYGEYNYSMDAMSKDGFSSALSKTTKKLAYDAGKLSAKYKVEKNVEALKDKKVANYFHKDSMSVDEAKKTKGLTDRQRKSVDIIQKVYDALEIKVRFFESPVVNGKRKGENGRYDPNTGTVYLDLYAGLNGEGTILYTASHELTHFIEQWSPAKFKMFADVIVSKLEAKGISVDELVQKQIDKAKKSRNEDISYETAFGEVIADSCESFLAEGDTFKEIASEVSKKDKKLGQKILDFFNKLFAKIKSLYQGLSPNSFEGDYVARMLDSVDQIRKLWAEALVDASETFNTIGSRNLEDFDGAKNEDGENLFQYRAMEADEEVYKDMLRKWGKMSDTEINNLFDTIDKAMDIIKDNLEILDYAWEADIDDRSFSPVKKNTDKLYKVSVDFSTLCRKRLLQQTIQGKLQEALDRSLTREESIAIRDALMNIQEEGRQIEIACALCYVESARMKSHKQIKNFLNEREAVLKNFFATKNGGDIKTKIKQAEAEARERLGVGNQSLKSLPQKVAEEIRTAKREAKESYTPSTEELELIKIAKGMTVNDFATPAGLENLAKNYPDLFDAYASYIVNATHAKGIENDTWWRAGDSYARNKDGDISISDTLIDNMNRENGLRSQSWSDFQVIHLLDYIAATIELSTRNSKEQVYTKVPDFVDLMGLTNAMLNMSLIPTREFNGTLEYDGVEGMAYDIALKLREAYPNTAGTICIGIDNVQIKMLLADITIDYVIPYHRSGMADSVRKKMHLPTWSEYEQFQSEKNLSREEAEKQAKKYGVKLLDATDPNYQKGTSFSEWFDLREAQQITKMENANPSNKTKQKEYGVMYGGYMAMQNAANNYLKLCAERGLAPKFSHEKADFTAEDNYWKLLIDRKMVNNATGEIIEQQTLKPVFSEEKILRILNDEIERYPKVKADQEYAIRKVTEKMLSGEVKGGMSSQDIAKVMKKPVDNVAKVNILESAKELKLSDRDSLGNELSQEQQEFFKDSKVRDKKGNLLVVYHGTKAQFNTFTRGDIGFHFGTKGAARGRVGTGKNVTIKEVYLNITNPIVFDEDLGSWDADYRLTQELFERGILTRDEAEQILLSDDKTYRRPTEKANKKLREILLQKGYDGIEYRNTFESKKDSTSYIAFNSNQVKEIFNFNPTSDPDIRYSFRGSESGMAHDALSAYDEELTHFIEQRGDYIVDSFDKLKQIVNLAFDNTSLRATAYFGIINTDTLAKIKNSIPNLPQASKDILFKEGRDYSIATTFDSIRHLVDNKALSIDDVIDYLDRLADTILESDSVNFNYYIKGKDKLPGLIFKKKFSDGTLVSFDFVSQKKRSVLLQTLYMDSADYQKKKSAETLLMQNAHSNTSKTQVGQTSIDSLPQSPNSVKSKFSDRYVLPDLDEIDAWFESLTSEEFAELVGETNIDIIESLPTKKERRDAYVNKLYEQGNLNKIVTKLVESHPKMAEYFANTKMNNKYNPLLPSKNDEYIVMFHGTDRDFNTFDTSRIGKHGTAMGSGIYFTSSLSYAEQYKEDTGRVIATLLKIEKPLLRNKLTITKDQFKTFIKQVVDSTGDDFLSNYGDVNSIGYDKLLNKVTDKLFEHNSNDADLIEDVYVTSRMDFDEFHNGLTETLGYDGVIAWNKAEGTQAIVFKSNQAKEIFNFNPTSNPDIRYSDRDTASFNGKPFWSGSVSLLDGVIEEVHSFAEAEDADFHHSMYFSQAQLEKMENGDNAFFWVENGKVQGNWRESVPKDIINKIEEQITIDTKYSDRYSYETLISKPDMEVTKIAGSVPTNRADVVAKAKQNAASVGKTNKDGSVSVYVKDIDAEVILSKRGLIHGLDRRFEEIAPVTLQAGEILKNSIKINELTPSKQEAEASYVLIGVAQNSDGELYAVRFVVSRFSNEVDSMEVLYAINAKKSTAVLNAPLVSTPNYRTTISIAELLDFVNSYFPDILPESVLRHYGYGARPEGKLGESALYQDRYSEDGVSNRTLLANALESVAQNDIERNKLKEYKKKVALIESEQAKLSEINAQIRVLSFAPGTRDTYQIKSLRFEANQIANRINTYDRQLLNLESTQALKGVLEREKKLAYDKARREGKEAVARQREKEAKTVREIMNRYQESRKKGIETRNKTALRRDIHKRIKEIGSLLYHGNKKRNVKEDMKDFVSVALRSAEILFSDDIKREDIIRNGFTTDLTPKEMEIADKCFELLLKRTEAEVDGDIAKITEWDSKLKNQMQKLSDAFIRERARLNKVTIDNVLSDLAKAYKSLETSRQEAVQGAYSEELYEYLMSLQEEVNGTIIKDMSLDQLEQMKKVYTMVLTKIRQANSLFADNIKESRIALGNKTLEEFIEQKKDRTTTSHFVDWRDKYTWNNEKPIYAFDRLGSETLKKLFGNVLKAEDVWAKNVKEASEFSEDMKKKYKYNSWDFNKTYKFTTSYGLDVEVNLEQLLSLYAFSKREQAKDHLEKGGFVFGKNTEVVVKKNGIKRTYLKKTAKAHNIAMSALDEVLNGLTTEQKAFADEMQKYLSDVMGAKGNEVSMALYGVELFKEKFYFPLKSAGQFNPKAKEADAKAEQGKVRIVNAGFSKETVKHANNPIILEGFMDVWASHVNEMAMYHAFVLPLEDFRKVYSYKTMPDSNLESMSVISEIQNHHGDAAIQYIDQLYDDINGGARSDARESIAKAMISKFKKASTFMSLSVIIQQPTSVIRALSMIDAKYFAGKRFGGKHGEVWEEVKKYAPVAIIKDMGYFDTNVGKSTNDYIKGAAYETFGEKAKAFFSIKDSSYRDEKLSRLPALADELTWCSIWKAVKRETLANNPKMDVNSEAFLSKCGERFTDIIKRTQVYDSVLSRSANMRSKSVFMNMLTSFLAEPTTSINMVEDAIRKGKHGDKKYMARTLGAVAGSIMLNAALSALVYAMRDDDEDETMLEKYMQSFTTELFDGLNPITYLPFFKDIWSILQGFDVERADMTLIDNLVDSLQQATKILAKDTTDMDEEELEEHHKSINEAMLGILDHIGSLTGIPSKNIRREIDGIVNTIKNFASGDKTTGLSLGNAIVDAVKDSTPVWGWLPDDSKSDKLYEAITSGDKAYVDRIKKTYKSDTAYTSALRSALKDNDSRITEAAQARYNGNIAEYTRIAKQIIAEGNFSQDVVVGAINTVLNSLKKGENTESSGGTSKVTSIYKTEDYFDALDEGTMASTVKEAIIQADIANGKDRDEAEDNFNSQFTNVIREEYEAGNITGFKAVNLLMNYGGKNEDEASSKIQYWDFKKQYPNYDLSEEAVNKYYNEVKSSGITVDVYYDYSKQRSKCKGTDNDGDGKTDSGSVKTEVLRVINSLPITSYQKDVLYRLNGWSESTLWQAPWH